MSDESQKRSHGTLDPWVTGEEPMFPQDAQGRYLNDDGTVMTLGQQWARVLAIVLGMALFYAWLINTFGRWN